MANLSAAIQGATAAGVTVPPLSLVAVTAR